MQRPQRARAFRATVGVAVLGLLLAGCGGDDGSLSGGAGDGQTGEEQPTATPADDALLVVATTSIVGDVVANVAGDEAVVEVLMPAGVDPHGYQPSGADAATLREADLVVAIGLGLEENLGDAIAAAEAEGVQVLELAGRLDPRPYEDDADEDEHADEEIEEHAVDDGHDHGPLDPHVWFDPVRMADGARLIGDELAALADGDWTTRADAYAAELQAVHEELEAGFAALPEPARRLVTNHDALGYLADRYDLDVIGTVVPGTSTMAEADARAFAELVETIEDAGVDAIFTENIETAALADQLASEVASRGGPEVEVVSLYTDALGEPGSGAETYLGLLRENGRRIVEALR